MARAVKPPTPRRGEIWLAELDKRRPVVILTRDPMGAILSSVVVAPVTSRIRGVSTEVELDEADGVKARSVANLDNVQLIPRTALVRRVGAARPQKLRLMCGAVAVALGCD